VQAEPQWGFESPILRQSKLKNDRSSFPSSTFISLRRSVRGNSFFLSRLAPALIASQGLFTAGESA